MISIYERAIINHDNPAQQQLALEKDLQQFFRLTPPLKIESEFNQISGSVDKQFFYLHLSLKVIEELDVEPVQAFALLEALRGIIYDKFNTITSRFIGKPLIENSRVNEIVFSAIDLFSRFTATYDSVIDEAKHFGDSQAFIMGSAIHRALADKSRLVLCYLQLYQDVPEATWKHINRLYLSAQDYNIVNQVIADKHAFPNHTLSIKQLYMYSMLLSCADTHTLSANDIGILAELLKDWLALIQAQPKSRFKMYDNPLCIDPMQLSTPVFLQQLQAQDSRSILIFDFDKLKQKLSKYHVAQSFVNGRRHSLSSSIANQILKNWLTPYHRRVERTQAEDLTLAIALGLTEAWPPQLQAVPLPSDLTAAQFDGRKLNFAIQLPETGFAEIDSQSQLSTVSRIKIIDESANGFCLSWPVSFATKLAHGQILVMHDTARQRFMLGQIVWLKQLADKSLQTGVAVLSQRVSPVYVTSLQRNNSSNKHQAVPAFLCLQNEGVRESFELVAPTHHLSMGQICILQQHNKLQAAQLLELSQQTELFQRFNLAFYE